MLARSGDPAQRTWDRLDDVRVFRIGREHEHAVVRIGVAKEKICLLCLTEDVGGEVYRLLGHVLHRVLLYHPAEPMKRLFRLFWSDHDLLASVAPPALYDQFIEVVHDEASVLLYRQRPGPGVLYEGLLSEVAAHHLGYEGADALIVYYLRIGGEEHVYFALEVRLEQARHLGIERILVDALVDHVYPTSCRPVDEVSFPIDLEIPGLGEDSPHLFGVDVVVEVELVVRTTAYDGQHRIRALGGSGPQSVAEASEPAVERQDGEPGHRTGEEDLPAHPAPAGHRGEADRHLGILFDDQVLPALTALNGDGIECYLAHGHGTETVLPGRVVEDAALDDLPWDDLLLACFEAAQEQVDGAQALGQAGLETFPVRGLDEAGDPVRRMGLVALLYAERVLLVEQEPVRLAQLPFPA